MSTSTRPGGRFTIGQLMGLIAGFAVLWAVLSVPGATRFIMTILLPMAVVVIAPLVVANHLVDSSLGVGCPGCGKPTLERRAVASFGARYFRCASCGVRCKRPAFGTWEDASGPEHDDKFRRKPDEDPWTAPPGLEDENLIYSKTHVNLVRSKRRRRPEDPNGPGLD